jgi:sec-independent protein translocase protein TatA
MGVGGTELVIIILVALLVFGPRRVADIGKGLGQGIRYFKKGISEDPGDEASAKAVVVPAPTDPPADKPA